MKNKLFFLLTLSAAALSAQPSSVLGVDTLLKSGPVSRRINLVFLGDGYTAGQQAQFVSDANTVSGYLLNQPPFINYKNYFNVFAIRCVSPQSGVSHPGTATDVGEPVIPVVAVNNSFDTQFDNFNIHRLIYSNDDVSVYAVLAAWFPAYDQAVILGNSPEYGGAGGPYAVSSMHSSSKEIVVHEMGHSFAGLADEYWAGSVYAAEKPNMTANANTATVKWAPWVGLNAVGVFPYGSTAPESQWYRPHQNCKMRYLNTGFCSVCKQTIIEKIHSLTNPIDAYLPDNISQVALGASQWFKGRLIKPSPNTLKRSWSLNSTVLARNIDSLQLSPAQLPSGNSSLVFSVTDTTQLSKDASHATQHSYSVVWSLRVDDTGLRSVKPELEFSVFPNPVSDELKLQYTVFEEGHMSLSISDAEGRVIKDLGNFKAGLGSGGQSINVSGLPPGLYFLSIRINGQRINHKFVVF